MFDRNCYSDDQNEKLYFSFVSENLKHILSKLEDDVCFENEVDDHVEMLKALYVNYKVSFSISSTLSIDKNLFPDHRIHHQQQVHKLIVDRH